MARLAILIPDMRGGGAEQVALSLIEGFVQRGHEVDLVLLNARGSLLQLLPPAVQLFDLKARRIRSALGPLVRYLRERKPDAFQASMWPVTLIAVIARLISRVKSRLLISDHSKVSAQFRKAPGRRKFMGWSIRLLYPLADVRVCVSRAVAVDLADISGLRPDDFEVVHNPVEQGECRANRELEAQWTGQGRRIINVGRLKWEKDQALLLRAFALVHRRSPANLMILGDGELRPMLEQLTVELGIADAVSMLGFIPDPTPHYASANLFVLSSEFEGFANVLVEAMASGVPVVSTDCGGPKEILDHGRYGRLVPVRDVEAMAEAIEAALAETPDRHALQARAREFRPELAVERYLRLMLPGDAVV